MNELHPDAAFDCLYIVKRLSRDASIVSGHEIHLFAYLACLLSIYSGGTASDWGYEFVGTELGAPYSQDLDAAYGSLVETGFLVDSKEAIAVSDLAEPLLSQLETLKLNSFRIECLRAACASTSALSVGMVSTALHQEPDLRRARATPATRRLLEGAAAVKLYEHFSALRQHLNPNITDLRLPAAVWLTALYKGLQLTVDTK